MKWSYWRQFWITKLSLWFFLGCKSFSVSVYLPSIWKDSVTHTHCLAVYVKEGLLFPQELSLENSEDSYSCVRLALLHLVPYFFFLHWSTSSSFWTTFYAIRYSQSTQLHYVFNFGDFNLYQKDWLTYFSGTNRPGELCYNIPFSNNHTLMVDFSYPYPGLSPVSLIFLFLDLFISSDSNIYFILKLHVLHSDCDVVTVSIGFLANWK